MDLRSPDERAHDTREAEMTNLCEASRMLSAFDALGFEKFATPTEIAECLGVEDTGFVQARLDDLVLLDWVTRHLGRYKANLSRWHSTLGPTDQGGS
jgi:hypothetical protein